MSCAQAAAFGDADGAPLVGEFLAVVIERHPSDQNDCGAVGDFIFGDITLTPEGSTPPANDNGNTNTNTNANINDNFSEPLDPIDDQPPDPDVKPKRQAS